MKRTQRLMGALLLICGAVSCVGGVAPSASSAPHPRTASKRAASVRCESPIDVASLLGRHALAYGTPDAIAARLPVVVAGVLTMEAQTGKLEVVVAPGAHRTQAFIAGISAAAGSDSEGAWSMSGASGIVERLTPVEGVSTTLEAWLLRRTYMTSFDATRDVARCLPSAPGSASSDGDQVEVAFQRPELGFPKLTFDLASHALVSVTYAQPDGQTTRTTYDAWFDADRGVRWPRRTTDHPSLGSVSTSEYAPAVAGLACSNLDAKGFTAPARAESCTAPPADRFSLSWPPGDHPRVRIPFTYFGGELLVRVKAGGRDVYAFLDSGAGATAVDATMPAGAAFRSTIEIEGAGATQKVRAGFGELPSLDLADLGATHVPTVSVPVPALEAFGDKRPEIVLGYSFFAKTAVRIDFKKGELVFAKSGDLLTPSESDKRSHAHAVPLRIFDGKIVIEGMVEGIAASFQLDTGNAGGLDFSKAWASANGLPGTRAVVDLRGRFGAGTAETVSSFFRLAKASVGPIAFDNELAQMSDSPGSGTMAGLVGNDVLARCEAVVVDVAKRTLWLEGACDGPVPERRFGWRLKQSVNPAFPDRPWVIGALWPGGSAERAGLRVDDRILSIDGKPTTFDVAPLYALQQRPLGTKLPTVIVRGSANERKTLTMELRGLPPEAARP